ncbi:MAG: DUF4160 domain-containing protein [Acidobacteria bacterium]|nr:DUF4160 domain-containing protein [Acidobacteriota bacterium]
MSPTVFRDGGFRYFFFSREEPRPHVHVQSQDGEAKFWLEPEVQLAKSYGLKAGDVRKIEKVVSNRRNEIIDAWNRHFGS